MEVDQEVKHPAGGLRVELAGGLAGSDETSTGDKKAYSQIVPTRAMGSRASSKSVDPATVRWSMYSGVYLFVWGVGLAAALSDILRLLADAIGLPRGYWMVVIAAPVLVLGPGLWWGLVERRRAYAYRWGGLFGLVIAVMTGLLWTVRFVSVWGLEMIGVTPVLILAAVVLGIVALAGLLTGIVFMACRRRFGPGARSGHSG